jgi:hypothetical protein
VLDVPLWAVDKVEERFFILPQNRHAESLATFDRLVDLLEVDDLVPQDADYVLQPLVGNSVSAGLATDVNSSWLVRPARQVAWEGWHERIALARFIARFPMEYTRPLC